MTKRRRRRKEEEEERLRDEEEEEQGEGEGVGEKGRGGMGWKPSHSRPARDRVLRAGGGPVHRRVWSQHAPGIPRVAEIRCAPARQAAAGSWWQ